VKFPGVIAMLVAPLVVQLRLVLAPGVIPDGLAPNELIVGLPAVLTVTVAVDVIEPDALLAVRM